MTPTYEVNHEQKNGVRIVEISGPKGMVHFENRSIPDVDIPRKAFRDSIVLAVGEVSHMDFFPSTNILHIIS